MLSSPVLAASATPTPSLSSITDGATSLLTWAITSFTSIVTWMLGNPLALTFIAMFVVGFAVALLVRVLRSAT